MIPFRAMSCLLRTNIHDLTTLHDRNAVALFNGAEPVRHDQDGLLTMQAVYGAHEFRLGGIVQRAGGFIQDESTSG